MNTTVTGSGAGGLGDVELQQFPAYRDSENPEDRRIESDHYDETHFTEREEGPSPPLGVKLTGYRLLNIVLIFSIGVAKAVLTYQGKSTAPTTLDWVLGVLLAIILYWLGIYERVDLPILFWFFHRDYSEPLIITPIRFVFCCSRSPRETDDREPSHGEPEAVFQSSVPPIQLVATMT